MKIKMLFLPLLTLLMGIYILNKWTLGFKAFTVFSYTLEKADPINKTFPDITFINQDSVLFDLKESQKFKLINFVYLNCPSVCHKVNNQLEKIYRLLDTAQIIEKIDFTTVSFDIQKDNLHKIRNYRTFFGENTKNWSFALPAQMEEAQFNLFLEKIGIWIYKFPKNGIINHSTNIFLLNGNNKIVRVFNPLREDEFTISEKIQKCLREKNSVSS